MTNWNDTVTLPSYYHTSSTSSAINNVDVMNKPTAYFYKGNTQSLEYPIPITLEGFTQNGVDGFRFGVGPFKNY